MSKAANWSYTATATHWKSLGADGWSGVATFAAPVAFLCDYSAEAKTMTDPKGREFVSKQVIYTERAAIEPGDFVLIGSSTEANPIAAGALEVRQVLQFADTFDRKADDYKVVC